MQPKSKLVAYLLWGFFGFISAHRFYIGAPGILRLLTLQYFTIGLFIDMFILGGMVDAYNDRLKNLGQSQSQKQAQTVVVNIASPPSVIPPVVRPETETETETKTEK